jgi:hypothetical protein
MFNRSLLTFLLLSGLPVLAQTGRLVGTVTDETGGVMTATTVTITQDATNVRREFITGATGNYDFPNLIPDSYTILASAAGFKATQTRVLIEVDQVVRQNGSTRKAPRDETGHTIRSYGPTSPPDGQS